MEMGIKPHRCPRGRGHNFLIHSSFKSISSDWKGDCREIVALGPFGFLLGLPRFSIVIVARLPVRKGPADNQNVTFAPPAYNIEGNPCAIEGAEDFGAAGDRAVTEGLFSDLLASILPLFDLGLGLARCEKWLP